jgi:pimeloyl-ACP methyl ester carboxylesterase
MPTPTVVLVHGAFAESASWNGVAARLAAGGVPTIAFANPLRRVADDAAALSGLVATLDGPVLLVGHSYGGMVATEAAPTIGSLAGVVYVGAFVPDRGESALDLSGRFPGSTLGDTLLQIPLAAGGNEVRIDPAIFPAQFAADVDAATAALMAITQRPVTEAALADGLGVDPVWRTLPSWSVFGELDRNIPAAAHRFMAERAAAEEVVEVHGASHALAVSHPGTVADVVLAAVHAVA